MLGLRRQDHSFAIRRFNHSDLLERQVFREGGGEVSTVDFITDFLETHNSKVEWQSSLSL